MHRDGAISGTISSRADRGLGSGTPHAARMRQALHAFHALLLICSFSLRQHSGEGESAKMWRMMALETLTSSETRQSEENRRHTCSNTAGGDLCGLRIELTRRNTSCLGRLRSHRESEISSRTSEPRCTVGFRGEHQLVTNYMASEHIP